MADPPKHTMIIEVKRVTSEWENVKKLGVRCQEYRVSSTRSIRCGNHTDRFCDESVFSEKENQPGRKYRQCGLVFVTTKWKAKDLIAVRSFAAWLG